MTIARRRPRAADLDQAPVDVGFAVERRRDALAVPVKALLARQGGGYAVELAAAAAWSASTPGLYADDMVEVEGDGLREGQKVVTAPNDAPTGAATLRRTSARPTRAASRRCAASR